MLYAAGQILAYAVLEFVRLTQIERWLRWLTGKTIFAVGIYITLHYIFGV